MSALEDGGDNDKLFREREEFRRELEMEDVVGVTKDPGVGCRVVFEHLKVQERLASVSVTTGYTEGKLNRPGRCYLVRQGDNYHR